MKTKLMVLTMAILFGVMAGISLLLQDAGKSDDNAAALQPASYILGVRG